jgi:DNA polymerase-3 subunit epsilon
MNFCTIDFETANNERASACQVGVVVYENNEIIKKWDSLINPEAEFIWLHHTSKHGIALKDVLDSPTFPQIFKEIEILTKEATVFHKSMFDRQVYEKSANRYNIKIPKLNWLDATELIKSVWIDLSDYSLGGVCKYLNYSYNEHHALEDAMALGHVIQAALKINGEFDLNKLKKNKEILKNDIKREKIKMISSDSGPLNGSLFIFSEVNNKKTLAEMAFDKGASVIDHVTSKVTHLVVGDSLSEGRIAKTTKVKRVEELNLNGENIVIMSESTYINYIKSIG